MPNTRTPPRQPNDSAHRVPNAMAMPMLRRVALRRFIPRSSHMQAMEISLIEIVLVSDARNSNRKKSVLHKAPRGISAKMAGSTSNTSFGPAAGPCP